MPLFPNPAALLCFYDPFFAGDTFNLFPWQSKILSDFAERATGKTKEILVTAPNGAGKSSTLMNAAAAWTAMSFNESQSAITSASKDQIDKQTMRALHRLAQNVNSYHRASLWDIQARHMEFKPTGSMIDARKSDEEGMQEGFHPLVPGGEFTILVDEGKSIMPDIYKGILKWTGCTRRMDITSASDPIGTFYKMWVQGDQKKYHITDADCPNITDSDRSRIIKEAGGINGPLAQQALKSVWAALAGSVVITLADVERCIAMAAIIKHVPCDHNDAGLDLSGGGDETILSVWNGNKQLAIEPVPFHDEVKIEDHIAYVLIPKWNLRLEHIRADAGGMGRAMAKNIAQKVRAKGGGYGENMALVYNQKAPRGLLKENWGNRGTQMWHQFSNLIRDSVLILLNDPEQTTQLSNRYYRRMVSSDKIILEPKPEAKAQGHPSPDRADAAVLAKENYRVPEEKAKEAKGRKMTVDELKQWLDDLNEQKFVRREGLSVFTVSEALRLGKLTKLLGR